MNPIHAAARERRVTAHALRRSAVGAATLIAGCAGAMLVSAAPANADSPCTTVITGTHAGPVFASGITCVFGDVHGPIVVSRGTTLFVIGGTVRGAIVSNGAAEIDICGSTTGAISITGSTGPVRIGNDAGEPARDDTIVCAPNVVHGSIVATNNGGELVIEGNTVSGSVVSTHNTGSPVVISGNHH